MLTAYLTLFIVALTAYAYLVKNYGKGGSKPRLPPGPVGIPILGYLPFLDVNDLGGSFSRLAQKYGEVFSVKVGTEAAVVLNSYDSIKSVLSNPTFNSRPDTYMFNALNMGNRGIASCSGETWEVQRKFTHRTLKALSRSKLDGFVKEEVKELVRVMREKAASGVPQEIGYDVNVAVANVTWAMVAGERRSFDDVHLRGFLQAVNKGIELASTSGILLFMPFLADVFPESYLGIDQLKRIQKQAQAFLQPEIDRHKESQVGGGGERDLIDAFLSEMGRVGAHKSFDDLQLLVLCCELFGAGGEPTSVTLKWAVRFLAMFPGVQRRAQREIDAVVGFDRAPEQADRPRLHYVQALMYDVMRFADIHPIGVLHSPSEDTTIDGYDVPKGSFVFPNLNHVHRDTAFWSNPHELYPEHWLDGQGKFIGGSRPGFLSFGVGKRNCPGQEMALSQLFHFLTALLQNFEFSLAPGDHGRVEAATGCVSYPKPYKVMVKTRF